MNIAIYHPCFGDISTNAYMAVDYCNIRVCHEMSVGDQFVSVLISKLAERLRRLARYLVS